MTRMSSTAILDRLVEKCPVAAMGRAPFERLLQPERLNQIFAEVGSRYYSKQLLFSQVVAVLLATAIRARGRVPDGGARPS
jgi:hypothetical protein